MTAPSSASGESHFPQRGAAVYLLADADADAAATTIAASASVSAPCQCLCLERIALINAVAESQ